FVTEGVEFGAQQCGGEDFDGGLSAEIHMFGKVHLSEAALPQQADEAIVAQLLSYYHPDVVGHCHTSLWVLVPGSSLSDTQRKDANRLLLYEAKFIVSQVLYLITQVRSIGFILQAP